MKAFLLTVGDEILIGQIVDSNAAYIAQELNDAGIEIVEKMTVSDTLIGIVAGLDRGFQVADIILMTGGLGPTKDDVTKRVLADYFATELVFHPPTWERLERIFARLGRSTTKAHRQQCHLPASADILPNNMGTAPGMWLRRADQKIVVAMPGVPYEMQYLMEHEVMPRLRQLHDGDRIVHHTILTSGQGESQLAELIADEEEALPSHIRLAYLPSLGAVRLRLTARGSEEAQLREDLTHWGQRLESKLGNSVYGYERDSLAAATGRLLQQRGLTLGTAESCTGGYLAHLLTSVPGSSAYFQGSVIAYSNELKRRLLQVDLGTLKKHGAVSEETVTKMVAGARKRLRVDVAVAISGIAGPTGGTADKPVGTIWIAIGNEAVVQTYLVRAGKDRVKNIEYAANQALHHLRHFVDYHYRD